jgi:hypothetical protein
MLDPFAPAPLLSGMDRNNKPTSAPLPGGKRSAKRADALRENLQKRKQQARARQQKEEKD